MLVEENRLPQTHGVFREMALGLKHVEVGESPHAGDATRGGGLRWRRRPRFLETREVEIHLVVPPQVVEHAQMRILQQRTVPLEKNRRVSLEQTR
jgi:hypothetical protein